VSHIQPSYFGVGSYRGRLPETHNKSREQRRGSPCLLTILRELLCFSALSRSESRSRTSQECYLVQSAEYAHLSNSHLLSSMSLFC